MLLFRKLYFKNPDASDIHVAARVTKVRCELASENRDFSNANGWTLATDLKGSLAAAASRRHLPLYTIEFSTSDVIAPVGKGSLNALTRVQAHSSTSSPEAAVSPVAIFRGARQSEKDVSWTLITAGLIQTLTINHAFDRLDGSLAEVSLTVLDLRLETDFLQAVDIRKMNARGPHQPNPDLDTLKPQLRRGGKNS